MAAIDYGAVVFKDAKVVNENQLVSDMYESVGWKTKESLGYACIGDKELTIGFGTRSIVVVENCERFTRIGDGMQVDTTGRMSVRLCVGRSNTPIHMKRLSNGVNIWHFTMKYKGHQYHVVFGDGIDPDFETWFRVQRVYHDKRTCRRIDKIYIGLWMQNLFGDWKRRKR